ncbi:hypothetical protein I203_101466 [Kwoniella mangroviensis CBS 8507]|uniref:uncharacterized protein n=1 Tax=Kwoniella mangroviensis CBS 8507 TaxID=1296122 RepID=UPI00080D1F0C|nr:uncharacterized protein I203_05519 [Kwoniella mangroviensis CBS 8507]OCF65273.1 hypothetical protein I203_05519 [Kwoniella mangroviensis CBS 8507]
MTENEVRDRNLVDKNTEKPDERRWKRRFGFMGISILILTTITLQLLVSLSTAIIYPLDLMHAELVPGRGDGIPRRISLGGSGGCMWFDDLSGPPTKCTIGTHFHPDAQILSLSEEKDTILWAMSAKIGVWRISNFLATGLVVCGLISFVLAIRFRRIRILTSAIFYSATIVTWAALICNITYLIIVQRNIRSSRPRFHADLGNVIWLWVTSTALVSVTSCLIVGFFGPEKSEGAGLQEESKEGNIDTRSRVVNDVV